MKKALLIFCCLSALILSSCSHSPVGSNAPGNDPVLAKVHITADLNDASAIPESLGKAAVIGDGMTVSERQELDDSLKGKLDSLEIRFYVSPSTTQMYYAIFPIIDGKVDGELEIFSGQYSSVEANTRRQMGELRPVDFSDDIYNVSISGESENEINFSLKQGTWTEVFVLIEIPEGIFENGKSYAFEGSQGPSFAGGWWDSLHYADGKINWICNVNRMKGECTYSVGGQWLRSKFDILDAIDDDTVRMTAKFPENVSFNIGFANDQPIKLSASFPEAGATDVPIDIGFVTAYFDQNVADAGDTPDRKITVVSEDGTDSITSNGYASSGNHISRLFSDTNKKVLLKYGTTYIVEVSGVKSEFGKEQAFDGYVWWFTTKKE